MRPQTIAKRHALTTACATTSRRTLLSQAFSALVAGSLGMPREALAQNPSAKLLVGFPPGGTSDAVTRLLADHMRGKYAPDVIVENRAGNGGQLAIRTLSASAADGKTLLLTPSSLLSISPFVYKSLPYNPLKDVVPVSLVCWFNHALAVGPLVPEDVKTGADFLRWCKANPDLASFGSPGAGSMAHLVAALLGKLANQPLNHLPYAGSGPGLSDLLQGKIAAMSSPVGDFLPHLPGGKIRLLAVSGAARSPFVPEVPTYRQSGYPIAVREWYGIFLPGNAAPDVVHHASREVAKALAQPEVAAKLGKIGLEVQSSSSSALIDLLKADAEEWRRLIRLIGFSAGA